MKNSRRRVALFVVLMLVFQPFATVFAGCVHAEEAGHAGHTTHAMESDHAMHQPVMNYPDVKGQQADCFANCECAGMCLHACHAPSLPGVINMIMDYTHEYGYLLYQSFSFPGYTFQLLRPPAVSV